MRILTIVTVACFMMAVAGCQKTAPQLAGMRFISKGKHEVGLSPTGVAMGHWRLEFHENRVTWNHSDVRERFSYTVEPDGTIKGYRWGSGDTPFAEGRFFPRRGELLWDGLWYRKVD